MQPARVTPQLACCGDSGSTDAMTSRFRLSLARRPRLALALAVAAGAAVSLWLRWLPEEGLALIAMGNLTYTGWDGVFDAATAALARTGASSTMNSR